MTFELANIKILDKIRAGLKLEAQEAPRKVANLVQPVYVVNDERIPLSMHPHWKGGVFKAVETSGDGVATTITATPASGKCWLIHVVGVENGSAGSTQPTALSIDGNAIDFTNWERGPITTGTADEVAVPNSATISRSVALPLPPLGAYCKIETIMTFVVAPASTIKLILWVEERDIDVPDVEARTVVA